MLTSCYHSCWALAPWRFVSYSLRPISCAAAFPTGYGPRGTPTALDHGNTSLLCDIVVRCFRSQVAGTRIHTCTTNQLHPSKVGFCLIDGDWMLTHTWGASALQSLLALFGGASAKLALSHDVSSAQDDTFCQGLNWLRRALLCLKRLWVRRQRRDLDVLK